MKGFGKILIGRLQAGSDIGKKLNAEFHAPILPRAFLPECPTYGSATLPESPAGYSPMCLTGEARRSIAITDSP
jgi:hypothetical protein